MITILGGGPGGLLLARLLSLRGVPCRVYEADESPAARSQGGMLDLHEDTGQDALRSAGLETEYRARLLEGGDATRVVDKTGRVWFEAPGDGSRPEIERGALRALLLASLPEGVVCWGAQATRVDRIAGGFRIRFANGEEATADILVGADGAGSQVRRLLTEVEPGSVGVAFAESRIHGAPERRPELAAMVGAGSLFALGEGRGILAHREPGGELCVYAAFRTESGRRSASWTLEAVLREFADWHPDLCALVSASDTPLLFRTIRALPIGSRWSRQPGVTLLGDAAHLMSPFAGEGVNLALADAADLARAILAHPTDLEAAFEAYETTMFARAEGAARESARGLDLCLHPDAPAPVVSFFTGRAPGR